MAASAAAAVECHNRNDAVVAVVNSWILLQLQGSGDGEMLSCAKKPLTPAHISYLRRLIR